MELIRRSGVWRLFDRHAALIITDERQLQNMAEDPFRPFNVPDDRGFSGEKKPLYEENLSLDEFCRQAAARGCERIEVSYDFFFGGTVRTNYPDSELTIRSFKIIHDTARKYGMDFSASLINPLDLGGGYARRHKETGYSYQFMEGLIDTDGSYAVDMTLQKQWTNNKGPIQLQLDRVIVFAFREEPIEGTDLFVVDPDGIADISDTARHEIDESSPTVTRPGYGYGRIRVSGRLPRGGGRKEDRCLAVLVYKVPEMDYFHENALPYIRGVIDRHHEAGITYQGFYSDEMHIQFDWDLQTHFGHTEINARYLTPSLMSAYAERYGGKYRDFAKYLVYFSYHQHDFLGGAEGAAASQHVMGRSGKAIAETWLFRQRYYEMLQDRVVSLSLEAKRYAESLFGGPIMTRAHATWQESPTCDRFDEPPGSGVSRYDYTPQFGWSSSIRENMSACYDYFKWNDYLTGAGTDHPEGGYADRNYYAQALACSFGVLNEFPYSYCADWGNPHAVSRRIRSVGNAYGNQNFGIAHGHDFVQGIAHRETDVLLLYPLALNSVEERFGSWMVQYGYCNYITQEKLLAQGRVTADGRLAVRDRTYRAVVVLFEPFVREETLALLGGLVQNGGKVVWTSIHPLQTETGGDMTEEWSRLFGVSVSKQAHLSVAAAGENVSFSGMLSGVKPMVVPTDWLPDRLYEVEPHAGTEIVARSGDRIVGTAKRYTGGGLAVYLGFRPRDDQSGSTGEDVDTLFSVLMAAGAYEPQGPEALSRPAASRYLINRFPNGAVSVANHYRTFEEHWSGEFFRDEEKDAAFLEGRSLPPAEISLERKAIEGRSISYDGTDTLTYRLDGEGTLCGFAGSETTGITVDDRRYEFASQPVGLVWTAMPPAFVSGSLEELYVIRADRPAALRIPLPARFPDGCEAALCNPWTWETEEPIAIGWDGETGELQVQTDDATAGRWIAVFRRTTGAEAQ